MKLGSYVSNCTENGAVQRGVVRPERSRIIHAINAAEARQLLA
jgi:hypothetical protein